VKISLLDRVQVAVWIFIVGLGVYLGNRNDALVNRGIGRDLSDNDARIVGNQRQVLAGIADVKAEIVKMQAATRPATQP
jgi:hypothetical protein